MTLSYHTIAQRSESFNREKGSKFLGFAIPVNSENEIKSALDDLWKQHPNATHICYAYIIGVHKTRYRANDDGEPSNSAGTPILGQIQSKNLTNVLVAVVRYYGGTKLGVGGLVSAYKQAAKDALDEAEIITQHLQTYLSFSCDYNDYPLIMNVLKQEQVELLGQNQQENVVIEVRMDQGKYVSVKQRISVCKSFSLIKEYNEE